MAPAANQVRSRRCGIPSNGMCRVWGRSGPSWGSPARVSKHSAPLVAGDTRHRHCHNNTLMLTSHRHRFRGNRASAGSNCYPVISSSSTETREFARRRGPLSGRITPLAAVRYPTTAEGSRLFERNHRERPSSYLTRTELSC